MACLFPFYVEGIPVPCGRCPACLVRRANSWAFRVMEEERHADCSMWITLTYDTEHVPITPNHFMTLNRRDVQLFMKRLRRAHPKGHRTIKFFGCGEYGTHHWRPHYHIALLNADERHLFASWTDDDGSPKGDIYIDPRPLSQAAISYTCFYMNKPRRVPEHKADDRLKEFAMMSKKMGLSYLTPEIVKYHHADINRGYVTMPGGGRIALPRYFADRLYNQEQKELRRDLLDHVTREVHKKKYQLYVEEHGDADGFIEQQNARRRSAVIEFQKKSKRT